MAEELKVALENWHLTFIIKGQFYSIRQSPCYSFVKFHGKTNWWPQYN